MSENFKGKIIFSENYKLTIESIKQINNFVSNKASVIKALTDLETHTDKSDIYILPNFKNNIKIDSESLKEFKQDPFLASYDESILELNSLEGKVRCTVHCSIIQNEIEYIPAAFVTLKFYTKSNIICENSNEFADIFITQEISKKINNEYISERKYFLTQVAPENTLIFIDGPLFSGESTSGNFELVNQLIKINCKPIFFVKNSESTIITERFNFAKGYNSDLHWAFSILKQGEVSPVFAYKSPDGRGKAMCFFKIFNNRSPVRIEFPLDSFLEGYYPSNIFTLIYYQYLANGDTNNYQPRIIQVAELYAREILKSTNLYQEIEKLGLTNSMNEERGF